MTGLKLSIEELVEKHLPDDTHFLVEVNMEEKAGKTRLLILIDADQGVTIASCAKVSRAVSEELEAKELMDQAYLLEVSSPGLDYPLSSTRQYQKNVGRNLKVYLNSGTEVSGRLLDVQDTAIKLLVKKKEKGKKAFEEEMLIPIEEIKKSNVQVSFK
jgi:ribosome maturation factor RimP